MEQIRAWNPDIKIVVSIVPKEPDAFPVCAASEELRKKVGQSCVEIVETYGFDGVDFDWEYPCVPSNGMSCTPLTRRTSPSSAVRFAAPWMRWAGIIW